MNKTYFYAVFLIVQLVFMKLLQFFPEAVENWYSRGIYTYISNFSRTIFGFIPFSVGDILYLLVLLFFIKWLFQIRKKGFIPWKQSFFQIIKIVALFHFFFQILWGINYHRIPLHQKLNINKTYSEAELIQFTENMLVITNILQEKITKNDSIKVVIPYTNSEIYELALLGYNKLPKNLQEFEYKNKSIKNSLLSYPLSYMGFGGYLNPFTNEAQVNYLKPKCATPLTTCHEMAHQIGIGSESECNFIGFITAFQNDDLYFQYAATSFALRYGLHQIAEFNPEKSKSLTKKINKGVLKNFKENKRFWESFHTPIDTFFEYFYHNFLKANQQEDGMEGYSKFIGLLIGYTKNGSLTIHQK